MLSLSRHCERNEAIQTKWGAICRFGFVMFAGAAFLFPHLAFACMPTPAKPGDKRPYFERIVDDSTVIFEGRLVKYEKYEVEAKTYSKSKSAKVEIPVAVKVYVVTKNWKGTKIGEKIKIAPALYSLDAAESRTNNTEFKLPVASNAPEEKIIMLHSKVDFSREGDIVYAGKLCPSEDFPISQENVKILSKKFPQAVAQ